MPTIDKIWTLLEVLKWSEDFLKKQGLTQPRSDAEQLLMATLQVERLFLYTNYDRPLSAQERAVYREYVLRRSRQEPVQYITGFTYFMSLKFMVNKDVLIPRPDTETVVENCIKIIKQKYSQKKLTVIDIGTGSGAIAISLAKFLPDLKIIALDNSAAALELAQKNAELNKVAEKIEFINSDVLEALIHRPLESEIIIISNPPYIDGLDFPQLPAEVKNYEPHNALYAGRDGLKYYRSIIDQAVIFGAQLSAVFFEVGYNQAEQVKIMLNSKFKSPVFVESDLGGISRVVYTLI